MKLWAIGGGKGGVGKTIITLAIGIALARQGGRVILVDGDLGGANLHPMAGIRFPEATLEDFLMRRVNHLADLLLPTPLEGIEMMCWGRQSHLCPEDAAFQKPGGTAGGFRAHRSGG